MKVVTVTFAAGTSSDAKQLALNAAPGWHASMHSSASHEVKAWFFDDGQAETAAATLRGSPIVTAVTVAPPEPTRSRSRRRSQPQRTSSRPIVSE